MYNGISCLSCKLAELIVEFTVYLNNTFHQSPNTRRHKNQVLLITQYHPLTVLCTDFLHMHGPRFGGGVEGGGGGITYLITLGDELPLTVNGVAWYTVAEVMRQWSRWRTGGFYISTLKKRQSNSNASWSIYSLSLNKSNCSHIFTREFLHSADTHRDK